MHLPPIFWRAVPTFASFSRCSAMPTSRPPRSTPTSMRRGWSSWSTPVIRLQRETAEGVGVDGNAMAAYPAPPMLTYLDFEKPIAALDQRIAELRDTASASEIDIDPEVT